MKSSFSLAKKSLALASIGMLSIPVAADWIANGGVLLDPNRQPFVFRGVTVNHSLAPDRTIQAIRDASAAGANAVQIEFAAGVYGNGSDLDGVRLRAIIQACKESKTVCVLEPNDVAGYPDAIGSKSPTDIVGYYYKSDIRSALNGQQDYIMLGMGNQALGVTPGSIEYVFRMQTYIRTFLDYFPRFMLLVDGSTWGQDPDNKMHELVEEMKHYGGYSPKIIYSVEMFDAYADPQKVRDYISGFSRLGAPLVIGGFAPVPYYHPHYSAPLPTIPLQLPAAEVMQIAQEYGVGYFAWSWSGNENSELDLVTGWDTNNLTHWGDLAINNVNGIKATAKPASHFIAASSSSSIASSSSSSISSTATNQPPVAMFEAYNSYGGSCTNGTILAKATGSYDPEGDSLTYSWDLKYTAFASGYEATFKSTSGVAYQLTLTVTDSHGAATSVTKTVSPIYIDCFSSSSSSKSTKSSSSIADYSSFSSSSVISSRSAVSSSRSSLSSFSSASSAAANAKCSYVYNSQWNNGFTAAIRIQNISAKPIVNWSVNWEYVDGSRITNLWNATLSGSNPYTATNLSWNSTIQPGQTIEFGFQGSKSAGVGVVPVVRGAICQ